MWEKCAHSVSCKMVGTVGEVCSARVRAVCSRARCAWDQPRTPDGRGRSKGGFLEGMCGRSVLSVSCTMKLISRFP